MKHCFIINPASGKQTTKQGLEEKIRAACATRGIEPTIVISESAAHARQSVKDFCSANAGEDVRVYACGGDGTLCIVANAVMLSDDPSRVSVGVIPVGTGNDYVRNFQPSELFFDIDAQIDATPVDIDLIQCNDFYAVNMINIGFDCQVVCKTAQYKKSRLLPSKLAYIFGLAVTLIKKPGVSLRVSRDGEASRVKQLLLTTFANGRFCGGGFNSNPNSYLNDGKINALFVNNVSRTKFISLVGKYKKGEHLDGSFHKILCDESAESYELEFDAPTNISVDGEIALVDHMKLSSAKRAVKFLLPKGISKLAALTPESQEAATQTV